MPKISGEVKMLSGPVGGGVHTYDTKYEYVDGSAPSYEKLVQEPYGISYNTGGRYASEQCVCGQ
jgi:hypothetical protein